MLTEIHANDIFQNVNIIHNTKGVDQMDRAMLRAEIARCGISNRELCKELSISEQAFYNKMGGKAEFKESEIKKLIRALRLSPEDINRIFLI